MSKMSSAAGIWAGIHSELVLKMKLNPKNDDITYEPYINADQRYNKQIWSLLNDDDYLLDWIDRKAVKFTEPLLESALHDGIYSVTKTFPVWKVVFAETMLWDVDNTPLRLEGYQKDMLLNPSNKQAWCLSRRLGKSFGCHTDALAYAICKPPTYSLIILQSWDTAKDALNEIDEWLERNPLLLKFAKGKLKKHTVTDKIFRTGSRISCRTATNPQKMRSKNPDRVYEDEKAFYPSGTEELSTMRVGQSLKRQAKQARMVMSSPNGVDNAFEDLFDKDKFPQYSTVEIPVCKKIIWDEEKLKKGLRQPIGFEGIVSNRISEEILLSQWTELGQTLFMQDYMLERTSFEGGAIPDWLIKMFFDPDMETKMESNKPCVISFDLGVSEHHRSTIGVGEIQPSGNLHIIRLYEFPIGTPFWRGVVDGIERDGVFNTALDWCNFYNVTTIIGDASGMGAKQYMMEFAEEAEKHGIPQSNVIPYHWSRQSDKFMGKGPLFRGLVKPTMEKSRVKCIKNHQLEHEMRCWQGRKTDSDNIVYAPMKVSDRDDIWMMVQQMIYAVFHQDMGGQPMPNVDSAPSVFGGRNRQYKPRRSSVQSIKTPRHRDNYGRKRR